MPLVQVWPFGQSFGWKHCTHWFAWHTGVLAGQSLFAWQTTHVPSDAQTLPGCAAQSVLLSHWTQEELVVSQIGVGPEQPALLVHPARQWKSCGSQMGAAAPQSELARHCTHCPEEIRQRGASAGQLLFCEHCTHCWVVGSQTALPPMQSLDVRQPTHAPTPEVVSQMGVVMGQPAADVHAAWH
jgi:hypothetical protein